MGLRRRKTRLRRRTPLRRVGWERVASALKPPSRSGDPRAAVCRLVDARSGRVCEWPDCGLPQVHRHHRLNRKAGGRHGEMRERVNGAAWLMGCCADHHRAVTSASGRVLETVRRMGWVLREGEDATAVPVWTRHHEEPVYLGDDGRWATYEEVGC